MIAKFDVFKDEKLNCYQLRTKTNCYVIEFDDSEKEELFLDIISALKLNGDLSLMELKKKISQKTDESKIIDVLSKLNEYHLLSPDLSKNLKSSTDENRNYYSRESKLYDEINLYIFGEIDLTTRIEYLAKNFNFKSIQTFLYRNLENEVEIESSVKNADFLIVDANEWSPFHIEKINELALKYKKPWLYIGGIEESNIKIGPLFYGFETGCYNCLICRIRSNHEYPEYFISYEEYLKNNQKAAKPDIIPSQDIIYNLVANLAFIEVTKFIELWSLPITYRTIISLDLVSLHISKHVLLKKPYCEICKPQLEYNSSPWLESITLK